MEEIHADAYYLPPGFEDRLLRIKKEELNRGEIKLTLHIPEVTRATVEALADYLKKRRERYLEMLPLQQIIHVLDEASRRWLDRDYHFRRMALKTITAVTGFSSEMVAASIDAEMESSLADDMWKAFQIEIGNPWYLDGFQFNEKLGGYTRAFGPELVVSFLSENIPALPHLLFMRAALVKAACLGKVAAGEPTFAPLYLKTIQEIDPEMAECMSVLYWTGGDKAVEDAAFNQADAVIVFGGVETCKSLVERIPRRIRVLLHGHKMGIGVIGREAMARQDIEGLAMAVAYDHAMFDQKACLAPHVYYVEEGGEVSPREFAGILARAMARLESSMPRGEITASEASAINQLRAKHEFRELNGDDALLYSSEYGTAWTVMYERDPGIFKPSPLNRLARIFEVEDIFQVLSVIKPLGPFLQNVAVAAGDSREKEFMERLGALGVTRITSPGRMPLPTMMWHHDGISPLASLLRWCDVEKEPLCNTQ